MPVNVLTEIVIDRPCGEVAAYAGDPGNAPSKVVRVPLFELFGKAGGGPACATLYLPKNLKLAADAPFRYSNRIAGARARRERIPEALLVDPAYFDGRRRG